MLRFQQPDEPTGFARAVAAARRKLEAAVTRSKPLTEEDFGNAWRAFKQVFCDAQHGKCGYCEASIEGTQFGDMEHYRPKASVERIAASVSRPWRGEGRALLEPVCTPGYWWLAYEWRNYLYACQLCNEKWKFTLFPLRGGNPTSLARGCDGDEEPLLLNPFEATPPERHLCFDASGRILPKDGSPVGEATIETCGLHREPLVTLRATIAVRVCELIQEIVLGGTQPKVNPSIARLRELGHRASPFAGMVRSLVGERLNPAATRALWPDHR